MQRGVFRVNCQDCLDRTNTYMLKISVLVTHLILKSQGIDILNLENTGSHKEQNILEKMDTKKANSFLQQFKSGWADCGNNISNLYSNTNSSSTRITKTGKVGIQHKIDCALIGANRLIQSIYTDPFKHSCLQIVAGLHHLSNYGTPLPPRGPSCQTFQLGPLLSGALSSVAQINCLCVCLFSPSRSAEPNCVVGRQIAAAVR